MITLYVNKKGEIRDVGTTTDDSLIALEVNSDDEMLAERSVAEICCYQVKVEGGKITSFIPYVDTKIIHHIKRLANEVSAVSNTVLDTQAQVDYIAMMTDVEM
ncbi:MAG: hypothetical protein IJ335_01260 [Lachnospiraceae bacterium]|nr:hypothetical protein [Lachnospiraceae bacterium]